MHWCWGRRIDKYRSAQGLRRGTSGTAVCCRCGRASRDSSVAIRIRTKSHAIAYVLVGRWRHESAWTESPPTLRMNQLMTAHIGVDQPASGHNSQLTTGRQAVAPRRHRSTVPLHPWRAELAVASEANDHPCPAPPLPLPPPPCEEGSQTRIKGSQKFGSTCMRLRSFTPQARHRGLWGRARSGGGHGARDAGGAARWGQGPREHRLPLYASANNSFLFPALCSICTWFTVVHCFHGDRSFWNLD